MTVQKVLATVSAHIIVTPVYEPARGCTETTILAAKCESCRWSGETTFYKGDKVDLDLAHEDLREQHRNSGCTHRILSFRQ